MGPRRRALILTVLAVALFAATLIRVFFLHLQVVQQPCDDKSFADNAVLSGTAPPSVVKLFPSDKIWLGAPLCVAIAGPANVATDMYGKPTLHLFLNGLELKGAAGAPVDRNKNLVMFDVVRIADDAAVWTKIIGRLEWWWTWGARVPVHVGVGTDKDGEFNNAIQTPPLQLIMVDPWSLLFGALTFVVAVWALVCAAQTSAILRDGNESSPFSLARVQMAFWLYLITAAFVFIWLVTGDYNGVLTSQSLTLLGISTSTALMAISVDRAAGQAEAAEAAASRGFVKDLLNDANGVALHRLQIAVWTLILGVVFFAEIYRSFRLPAFDSNLLILMGISGVTYAGFKYQAE
jgi:hypothetical protein